MSNKKQKLIYEILGTRPVAFNPLFAKLTGSVTAGLFLSQLLYWYQKGKDKEWMYKTIKEIEEETALSRWEQETAVKKLKRLKIIEVKLKGVPAKRHFKINLEHIDAKLSSLLENHKLDCGNTTNKNVVKPQTITDSTTDITADTSIYNTKFFKKNLIKKEHPYTERITNWAYNRASSPPTFSEQTFRYKINEAIDTFGPEKIYGLFEKETNAIAFLTNLKHLRHETSKVQKLPTAYSMDF